ncbi:Rieske (2Fe-2S) protein [Aciditerrimonas ferrireducens]|uniref:Rieske (2Fe-2S) protein n=1 Tax=Aciditerrimonas ferrireducens TaxID=667306 RepID=A0ABV6C383_9ACTN|nr:Rieske 2Fe-2S domain-containing protein [Aciditerrimonas ferrireducens]
MDRVALGVADGLVERAVRRAAGRRGAEVVTVAAGPSGLGDQDSGPLVVVLDIEAPGVAADVAAWRDRWPETLVLGVASRPDRDRWLSAERAGFDRVVNRGAVGRALEELLTAGRGRRWFPVLADADAAGHLGLVARLGDSPVGPLAVYRVEGAMVCFVDRCPHAGRALAEGVLEGSVLTCPGHGSQFDLKSGARLRGPADEGIALWRLVLRQGRWCLPLGPTSSLAEFPAASAAGVPGDAGP